MFPAGWPGFGLLLLRAAGGGAAIVQGIAYFYDWRDPRFWAIGAGMLAVAAGASFAAGFLTPLAGGAAALCILGITLGLVPAPPLNLFEARLSLVFEIIISVAVGLLGPGAFSLDAKLFGRRRVIIPPAHR